MPKAHRLILYISVKKFHGVTQLKPESGWENPSLRYHIGVQCTKCNLQMMDNGSLLLCLCAGGSMTEGEDGNEYHKPLTCPVCMGCGGLRILNRGGEPITDQGQEMPVMEIEVVGPFVVHKEIPLFYFRWICRKVDGSGYPLGPFYVEGDIWDSGDESYDDELLQIIGLKGYFQVAPWEGKVEGLWIEEASRLSQDCDSDSSLEDSDADSDD